MFSNLALTIGTIALLVGAGAAIGRRLLPRAPHETQLGAGATLALAWLGAAAGLGLLLPLPFRLTAIVIGVAPVFGLAALAGRRAFFGAHRVSAVWATVALGGMASAVMATPFVPVGQVHGGVVFETRVPNRPADNRLPYRTGQYILHEIDPSEPDETYFPGWRLTDRTQLTAAASSTIAAALGAEVPRDALWFRKGGVDYVPVDRFGYWVFRSTAIAFNALLPLAVAALAAPWLGRRRAAIAAIVAALSVFALVETMFTWPKFAGVAAVAAGGGALMAGAPIVAGVLMAAGYLAHPLTIFCAPALVYAARRHLTLRRVVWLGASALAAALPWFLWTALDQHTTSSMTLYPLGWGIPEGSTVWNEVPNAIESFERRFPVGVLNDRWISLRDSIGYRQALDVLRRVVPPDNVFGFYDRTLIGFIGFALLPVAVLGAWIGVRRRASAERDVVVVAVMTLGIALVAWGLPPRALGADTLQPMIPTLAILVAIGLSRYRWALVALPFAAIETWSVVRTSLLTGYAGTASVVLSVAYLAMLLGGAVVVWLSMRSDERRVYARPAVEGPSRRRAHGPWWAWSLAVVAVFAVLIATGTTLSSVGIAELRATPDDEVPNMVGTARSIRSDEFLRTSVWRIGALADRDISFASPLAEEADLITAVVTRGGVGRVVLFESLLIDTGAVLPDRVSFALIWWAPSALLWLFAPRLFTWFGMRRVTAVLTTALVYFSPAVMWWSLGPVNSGLSTSIPACLLFIHASRMLAAPGDGSRPWRRYLIAGALAVAGGAMFARIPFTYGPWAIVTTAAVAVPTLFVMVSQFRWKPSLSVVAAGGAASVVVLGLILLEHRTSFGVLQDTVYPGSRRSTGRAIDIGRLFGAPHLDILERSSNYIGANQSELATAYTFLAIPCVAYAFGTIREWRTRLSPAWWGHAVVFAVLFVWVSVDIPEAWGTHVPGLALAPAVRTAQVVGFAATAWFGVTISLLASQPAGERRLLAGLNTAVVAVLLAAAGSSLRTLHVPDLLETRIILVAVLAALMMGAAIWLAHRRIALVPLVAGALVLAAGVNPVISGFGELRTSPTARTIRRIDRATEGYWISNSLYTDALLMANAIPSISGQQFTGPRERSWLKLDPTAASMPAWNRGASFITFVFDPAVDEATGRKIEAAGLDVVRVTVNPCDDALRALGAGVLVSTVELDEPCLERRGAVLWTGVRNYVYTIDE